MEINYDICNMLDNKMMEYSAYVILHRALPSLEDGFKISLRRILYTMYKENITKLTKSANVSGQVMKIHPHSDCYPTIVNMVQKDNHVNPFIIGKGAFAYHTSRDTQPASSRYSEVKIAPYSLEMLEGLKSNMVNMIPTFDSSGIEPEYLPTKHCNLLTHCQQGLAVGMASNFPSFNIIDVCDCTVKYLKQGVIDELVPDFPTGGKIIYNSTQIDKINNTGTGSVVVRAKYETNGEYILIKEIPYSTTREAIIDKIIELVKANKIKEIIDIKDTTDINGMEIEIKVKKNSDCDMVMNKLYQLTPLESTFSANMNCLVDNKPKVLGVKSIIQEWIKFRKQCLKRELEYDIKQLQIEKVKLDGLAIILNDLDKAISIIRSSKTEKLAIQELSSYFNLTQEQCDYICTIKMVNMNEEWLTNKINKLTDINQQLEVNQLDLQSEKYYDNRIISDLEYVKKTYGQPRKTTIIHEDEIEVTQDVLITEENCAIMVTKEGYVKRTNRLSQTHKLKDGDEIILNQQCTNKHTLLVFTSLGNVYKVFLHDLETTLPSNLGQYLPSLLQLDKDENIISVQCIRKYEGCLINVFENNKLSKVNLSSFRTEFKRTCLKNAISLESKLIKQYVIEDDIDLLVRSSIDKVLIVNTKDFNAKNTKISTGDALIKAKNDSIVSEVYLLCELDNTLLDVEFYKGKRGLTGFYLKKDNEIKVL